MQEYPCVICVHNILKKNNIQRYQHNLGGVYAKILLFLSRKTIFAAYIWVLAKKNWFFLWLKNIVLYQKCKFFLKFFLVVWKNVVSLHSLSRKQALLIKRQRNTIAKRTLNYFGTWDSVCPLGAPVRPGFRDTRRVKGKNKQAILTMKSLILAQDER